MLFRSAIKNIGNSTANFNVADLPTGDQSIITPCDQDGVVLTMEGVDTITLEANQVVYFLVEAKDALEEGHYQNVFIFTTQEGSIGTCVVNITVNAHFGFT